MLKNLRRHINLIHTTRSSNKVVVGGVFRVTSNNKKKL